MGPLVRKQTRGSELEVRPFLNIQWKFGSSPYLLPGASHHVYMCVRISEPDRKMNTVAWRSFSSYYCSLGVLKTTLPRVKWGSGAFQRLPESRMWRKPRRNISFSVQIVMFVSCPILLVTLKTLLQAIWTYHDVHI